METKGTLEIQRNPKEPQRSLRNPREEKKEKKKISDFQICPWLRWASKKTYQNLCSKIYLEKVYQAFEDHLPLTLKSVSEPLKILKQEFIRK